MTQVLSPRAHNRALLARQFFLGRVDLSPAATIEHLVGMQAQQPRDPYIGLWSRLETFDPETLSTRLPDRQAVRGPVMRSTLHLLAADDALTVRPLRQPAIERAFRVGSPLARALAGIDLDALLAKARTLLESKPLTRAELGRLLVQDWP